METEKIETEKLKMEIPEQTLPKPQKEVETITGAPPAKKQRSEAQMRWSRELGKKSQEFKRRKHQTMISTVETTTNDTATNDTTTNDTTSYVKTSTPYLLYFTLIGGGLVGTYYYFTYKHHSKTEAVKKPKSEPKTASTLTKME